MSFQDKYKILSALSKGESPSFRALQVDSERPVLVHRLAASKGLPGQPDLAFLIFKFLRTSSAQENRFLLDMGEDDGCVYVVTADVPECQDLRAWLQSIAAKRGAGENGGLRAGEAIPDGGNLDFTRTFTSEALSHVSNILREGVASGPSPSQAPSPAPAAKRVTGGTMPPARIRIATTDLNDTGSRDFTAFWEKYSPEKVVSSPTSAPSEQKASADQRSDVPGPPADSAATSTSPAKVAAAAEAEKSTAGVSVDAPPTSTDPATRIPTNLAELMKDVSNGPRPRRAPEPVPASPSAPAPAGQFAEQVPRKALPGGFEVVFQSNKPRTRPTMTGLPEQSGIMAAPPPAASRVATAEPKAAPAAPPLPDSARPLPARPAEKKESRPGLEPGNGSGQGRNAEPASALPSTPSPPLPPPPFQQVHEQSQKPTRMVPEPLAPPVAAALSATRIVAPTARRAPTPPPLLPNAQGGLQNLPGFSPPGNSPLAAQPHPAAVAGLGPASPHRGQPGEYTRMTENVRALAGPLPPLAPPAGAPGAGSAPGVGHASYAGVPAATSTVQHGTRPKFETLRYISNDLPAHALRKKRKAWVPILIFSGLFLMTVGLLLFFAVKH